jgi:glycosyltransferase involved in cell wall biosynthesis
MTRALKICIVTNDIVGPIRNGGIGTAYYSLGVALARAGHDVTVLFGLGLHCEVKTIAHWREHYRSLGITFVPLPDAPFEVKGSWAVKAAYRVHFWLQQHTFDVVHFHEWRGIGYYALLAQRQGLSLQGTVTCVGAHSPTFWHKEGMRETPGDAQDFELDFMERESVRLADVVWFPSRHMEAWMAARQWPAPRRSFVRQYVMLDRASLPVRLPSSSSLAGWRRARVSICSVMRSTCSRRAAVCRHA